MSERIEKNEFGYWVNWKNVQVKPFSINTNLRL
jgi:hypothetical protein